jgi:hypothetical protein
LSHHYPCFVVALAAAPPVLVLFARFFYPSDAVEFFDRNELSIEIVTREFFERVETEDFLLLEILQYLL